MKHIAALALAACVLSACAVDLGTVEQSVETATLDVITTATGATDSQFGIRVLNSLNTGASNGGIQVRNEASNSGPKWAIHAVANGFNGNNWGLLVGAKNATNNIALQTNHGDVVLNADSGQSRLIRNVTLGSSNDHLRTLWGHSSLLGAAPMLACGIGATVVGVDVGGVLTTGSDATSCVLTFSRTFNREVSCVVTARSGTPVAYAVTGTALTLVSVESSAKYDYRCDCIGGGGCQ